MNFVRSFFSSSSKAKESAPLQAEDLRNTRGSALAWVHVDEEKGQLTLKAEVEALLGDDDSLRAYVKAVFATIPQHDDPTALSDFHYEYRKGKLVNITTGTPFHWVNQYHYDALGDVIVKHVQMLMVKDHALTEVLLPLAPLDRADPPAPSSSSNGPTTGNNDNSTPNNNNAAHVSVAPPKRAYSGPFNNIFVSHDWDTCDKLMLLIQGSGAVRAGQWARALCINESLELGTILPYLTRCKELGYGVIVFNPNLNSDYATKPTVQRRHMLTTQKLALKQPERVKIKGHSNPHKHDLYVWDHFVRRAKAKVVAAVAHSAGGDGACALIRSRGSEVSQRLCAVAFTDSVHAIGRRDEEATKHFVQKRCRNWVRSSLPLDTKVGKHEFDCLLVSAGHEKHEYTSGTSIASVFAFLVERTSRFLAGEDPNDKHYDRLSSTSSTDGEGEASDDPKANEKVKEEVHQDGDNPKPRGKDKGKDKDNDKEKEDGKE